VPLFEGLHKQLILTPAGQEYLVAAQKGFCLIRNATERLKPQGVTIVLSVGVYARFDLARLRPNRFRAAHPTIGLRIMEPAGLHELAEGKVDLLVDRSGGRYPGYRCEHLGDGPGVGDYLICAEGTASCPEIESLRAWLNDVDMARPLRSCNIGSHSRLMNSVSPCQLESFSSAKPIAVPNPLDGGTT
jgi:LysR family transcriptional regulator, glycine cleavage system transcriptional activator